MCRFLRSNILLYPPRPAPEVVHTTQFPALYHAICLCVTVLRRQVPGVRILPVAPRAAPYGVLLFLFCMDFMGQQKGGFEQPVPRALRAAGQKRPGGAFLGRGLANPFGRTKGSTFWGAALFVLHGFYGAVLPQALFAFGLFKKIEKYNPHGLFRPCGSIGLLGRNAVLLFRGGVPCRCFAL